MITELALRVRPAPRERIYEGVFFEDFAAGAQALRALAREHALPDVARLSDEQETRMSLALAGHGRRSRARLGRALPAAARIRRRLPGDPRLRGRRARSVARRRGRALELVRRRRRPAGRALAGQAWLHGRFAAPYLRDELLTHGRDGRDARDGRAVVEAAAPAPRGRRGDRARRCARRARPGSSCATSRTSTRPGASLYFTLIARQREGEEIEQWRAVKQAAGDAILAGGGTITHHHAVGRDHARWMHARGRRRAALAALRAVKAELDPRGIMNPGKLLRRGAQPVRLNGPRRTTWPGWAGLAAGLARQQHFAEFAGVAGQRRAAGEAVGGADRRALAERHGAGGRVVQPDRVEEALGSGMCWASM